MTEKELKKAIEGCRKQNRGAQKRLYRHFYGYVMSVALRYSGNREEAEEILNDAFLKVFAKINDFYSPDLSLKGWIRKIAVNTAIDYYRKNDKIRLLLEIPDGEIDLDESVLEEISANEIMKMVQELTPGYRTVFNLYAIEGYKHHEIAEMLNITEGASKSNLHKARQKLQQLIAMNNGESKMKGYGG